MSVDERSGPKGLGEQLARLIASPSRMKALTILTERVASPKEIAARVGLSISMASHHVKKLEELGLIELVETCEDGSAVQHFYRAVVRPLVGNEEWQKLSVAERQRFSIWIVQLLLADAARSFEAELFDAPANNHLSRTVLALDRAGFAEVAEIQDRALDEIIEVQARSAERLAGGDATAANVVVAMMCFELPERTATMKVQEVASVVPAASVRKSN